jgi:phosphotransferase system HPr (HPr) family protein
MGEGEEPIRRKVTLKVKQGLHLTPISVLVRHAGRFSSRISLSFDGRVADVSSVYDLMLLAAPCGSEMTLETQGDDAAAAADEIERLFLDGFQIEEGRDSSESA